MARKGTQLPLARKHGWGGRRPGAGRKRKDGKAAPPGVPHLRRPRLTGREPVGVTLKLLPGLWSLRGNRLQDPVREALRQSRQRRDFRVVHFSILSNHLHLIVEAHGATALSRGVQALEVRLARRLNRVMGRAGRVFADRFHMHLLRTPSEVARARRYVLDNYAIHCARRGEAPPFAVDPLSSARLAECVAPAVTWLLRAGFEGRRLSPQALALWPPGQE